MPKKIFVLTPFVILLSLVGVYFLFKDNWTRFAKYLTSPFRVIAPDLAGFAEIGKISHPHKLGV